MLTKSQTDCLRGLLAANGFLDVKFDSKADILTVSKRLAPTDLCSNRSFHLFMDQGYVRMVEQLGDYRFLKAFSLSDDVHPDIADSFSDEPVPSDLLLILDACERADGYPTHVEINYCC